MSTWALKDTFTIVLGFILGGFASFSAWWFVAHFVVPSLSFSKAISKRTISDSDATRVQYRIKMANAGRRAIIDVELFVRAYLHVSPDTRTITVVNITLSQPRLPLMPKGGLSKVIKLLPEQTEQFSRYPFPQDIRDKYACGTLLLEDILALDSKARLQIIAFGYDSFSGSRRLWQQEYRGTDVHTRLFRSGSLELKEDPQTAPSVVEAQTSDTVAPRL